MQQALARPLIQQGTMTNIGDALTAIITTSVTPSAPSTELVSSVFDSFRVHCPGLLKCRIIVVFDGFDGVQSVARLKKGRVTPEQANAYSLYKANIKKLVLSEYCGGQDEIELAQLEGKAEFGGDRAGNVVPFTVTRTAEKKITFIEPSKRLGFGLAVRSALRMTGTPYVWVQQHDWVLSTPIPIAPLLDILKVHDADSVAPVKYVCFPAIRMLGYATSADVEDFPVLKGLTSAMKGEFTSELHPDARIPLTPLFFWHDKPHIASTAHYLNRVFPSRLAMLRGDFIEDKIGQRARAQMKEGEWSKWATWLYYPNEGQTLCVRHLQGRVWRGAEREASLLAERKGQQVVGISKPALSGDAAETFSISIFDGAEDVDKLDGYATP